MRILLVGILTFLLLLFSAEHSHAETKMDFWRTTPRGANVLSGISASDLTSARQYGLKLLRIGAVGSPSDFRFLVKGELPNDAWDDSDTNLGKLINYIQNTTDKGFNVVLTLSHIKGRAWNFRKRDYRFWEDAKYQIELINVWRKIAEKLKDNSRVVGFEPMNEPYLPRGVEAERLIEFYRSFVEAIRKVDSETPILLSPPNMSSHRDFDTLATFAKASKTILTFHYYEPFPYWSAQLNQGKYKYPGEIPESEGADPIRWDIEQHRNQLKKVGDFAARNKIESYRIFVGEFGVWRRALGKDQYLKELTSIFRENGWSWAYYAFRENDWGNADLELTPSGLRKATSTFKILSEQFQ